MDNKVTIIGFTGSGKTTYLAGMYMCMSGAGLKHFSLSATDMNQDVKLEEMWENLCDGRFPVPSSLPEKYRFHIAHNYQPVCEFDWLDYPGGLLADPNSPNRQELENSIATSDCLLLVLDGALFSVDAEDEDEYADKIRKKIHYTKGMRNELNAFARLSQNQIRIPPVCIVITKCDLVDPVHKDTIESVLRDELSFFADNRVLIVSVSVGRDVETNGPDPFCIEQPIAFAVLMILLKYMESLKAKRVGKQNYVNQKRNWFTAWLDSGSISQIQSELKELESIGDQWSKDASQLIGLFTGEKPIFVNGKKLKLRDYLRNEFQGLQ